MAGCLESNRVHTLQARSNSDSHSANTMLQFKIHVTANSNASALARLANGVSLFKDVASKMSNILENRTSDVYKQLRNHYKYRQLTTKYNANQEIVECIVDIRSQKSLKRIKSDISTGHLSKLIKQYAKINESSIPWELHITLVECCDYQGGASNGELETEGTTASARAAEAVTPQQSKDRQVQQFYDVLHNLIIDKNSNQYDFLTTLRTNKGKTYRIPTELLLHNETPLLHACIEHGRLSFLKTIFLMGWLTPLLRMKVPDSSPSSMKGLTPLELEDTRRYRKAIDELKVLQAWEESMSTIMKAARAGDLARVTKLISVEGEKVHYRDDNNGNALFWAVINGSEELLELLLQQGCLDSTMRTQKMETLLHVASSLGHSHLIATLINVGRLDPWLEDSSHKTAMDKVAETGNIETLEAYIKCSVQPKPSFVVYTAYYGRQKLLDYVITKLKMPVDSQDVYKRTPLLRAIEAGRKDIVQYLLTKGAKLSMTACTRRTALHVAAEYGDVSVLENIVIHLTESKLLNGMINSRDNWNGVELCFLIRGRDKGRDAWHYVEVRRSLVPLFLIRTKSGNVDVATFGTVLKSGWGMNPEQETMDYVENLFKERRLNQEACADQTPLHIAIFKGNISVARMLVENGADVNIKDSFGLTPIMTAAAKNNTELVQYLEEHGANLKDVSKDGQNALQIAEENMQEEVVNYIKGRDYSVQIENFVKSDVTRLLNQLHRRQLDGIRTAGADVKRHIIDTLRDFRIDINQTLLDLGSGPILQESTA